MSFIRITNFIQRAVEIDTRIIGKKLQPSSSMRWSKARELRRDL